MPLVLKIIHCLRRRPDLTPEEFEQYFRDVHAPLVAERAERMGIVGYVLAHTRMPEVNATLQEQEGSPEPFDGIAELWVESLDGLASQDPAVQQAAADLQHDQDNFIDRVQSPIWIAEENVVVPVA
jgi:uncharacterized protein (TIGR02118 family)